MRVLCGSRKILASTLSRKLAAAQPFSHGARLATPVHGTLHRTLATKMEAAKCAFTGSVVEAMQALYPEEYADRTWDNVGLLLENTARAQGDESARRVLLTNDLTPEVASEAITKNISIIVAYHPFIFKGMKFVTLQDPHQKIVIQLARANIAVYCPHTALDAAPGGLNDWLADIVSEGPQRGVASTRSVVVPLKIPSAPADAGYGRLVKFAQPVGLRNIVRTLLPRLGAPGYAFVVHPGPDGEDRTVSSVAVCAGSGWDVLQDCDADLFVTGEMSHHNALRVKMLGKCAVTVFHSNSERQFLRDRLRGQLEARLTERGIQSEVLVSELDKDPFSVWQV